MQNSIYKSEKAIYLALLMAVAVLFVLRVCSFGYGFFSLWDESYLLLKCRNAYEGIISSSDGTFWAFIAVKWFPYLDLTNEIQSSWASAILLVAGAINAIIAAVYIKGKQNIVRYAALFFLMLLPVISGHYDAEMPHRMGWGTEMNYVVMQSFMVVSSVASFLMAYYAEKLVVRYLSLFVTGILCGLGIFMILPATMLLLLSYFILIIAASPMDIRRIVYSFLTGLCGVVVALIYMHLCVIDLFEVYRAMQSVANFITQAGIRYTPLDMILSVLGLLKTMLYSGIYVLIAYCVSLYVSRYNRYIGGIIYVLLMVLAVAYVHPHYRIAPASCMFINAILVPCVYHMLTNRTCFHREFWQSRRVGDIGIFVFLLLCPIIASIGTNTALYGRIACFMGAWAFLWVLYGTSLSAPMKQWLLIAAFMCLLIPITYNMARTYYHHATLYTESIDCGNPNSSELCLTPAQADYYNNIYAIVNRYNFQPQQSVVFASLFDFSTVYVLDAILSNDFHMSAYFPFIPTEEFLQPDFIILTEYEREKYHLERFPWGWPENYDMYEIGSPETLCGKFDIYACDNRYLYCRRLDR